MSTTTDQQIRFCTSSDGVGIAYATIEPFNGRFREECLNVHWFASLEDAQQNWLHAGPNGIHYARVART